MHYNALIRRTPRFFFLKGKKIAQTGYYEKLKERQMRLPLLFTITTSQAKKCKNYPNIPQFFFMYGLLEEVLTLIKGALLKSEELRHNPECPGL